MCHAQKKIRKSFITNHLQKHTSIRYELATILSCQLGRTEAKVRPDQTDASPGATPTISTREFRKPGTQLSAQAWDVHLIPDAPPQKGGLDALTKRQAPLLGSGESLGSGDALNHSTLWQA